MENLLEFKVKFASFDELILSIIWEKYDTWSRGSFLPGELGSSVFIILLIFD